MSTIKPNLDQILTRGVEQILPDRYSLKQLLIKRKIRVYLGIDPTGSLLTLGHSVVLRKLQQFANLGHEVILLIGNGTVRIGDPTGKDTTRPELTDNQIETNFKNWQSQASKILNFDQIKIVHNGDWLDKLRLPDFIKLMAKTTVQQLIERDMFQQRLKANQPIFTHELMYPLLQGYDSVALDVDLEIGGTDQTFNMMMGRTLQKIYHRKEKWVLTTPIITGLDGRKMSKSYNNFVALTEPAADMYGKLMSITDDQIIPYFRLLTDVEDIEIDQMQQQINHGANPMKFKKLLAKTITTFYHNATLAQQAQENFEAKIQHKQAGDQLIVQKKPISVSQLIQQIKPKTSHSQIRRLIEQGGVQLNGQKLTNYNQILHLQSGDIFKVGKKEIYQIQIIN